MQGKMRRQRQKQRLRQRGELEDIGKGAKRFQLETEQRREGSEGATKTDRRMRAAANVASVDL